MSKIEWFETGEYLKGRKSETKVLKIGETCISIDKASFVNTNTKITRFTRIIFGKDETENLVFKVNDEDGYKVGANYKTTVNIVINIKFQAWLKENNFYKGLYLVKYNEKGYFECDYLQKD